MNLNAVRRPVFGQRRKQWKYTLIAVTMLDGTLMTPRLANAANILILFMTEWTNTLVSNWVFWLPLRPCQQSDDSHLQHIKIQKSGSIFLSIRLCWHTADPVITSLGVFGLGDDEITSKRDWQRPLPCARSSNVQQQCCLRMCWQIRLQLCARVIAVLEIPGKNT